MHMSTAAFLQAPLIAPFVGKGRNLSLCKGRSSSFAMKPSTTRRSRHRSSWQCISQNENSISFGQLEIEIRKYLEGQEDPGTNPLAYTKLGKAGRTDLISRIMEHGGYLEVSKRLGIQVDESDFIPPPPVPDRSKSLFGKEDDGATLVVGRDLEARLGEVDQVMGDTSISDNNSFYYPRTRRAQRAGVPSGEELRLANEKFLPPIADEPILDGERFTLTTGMRFGMLLLAALTAFGFGRASTGLINEDVVTICRSASIGLAVAHLVVGLYAGGVLAAQYNRNRLLWSAKVLLSGPLGLAYLRSLGSL